ncbi:acyl-CoA thioesterase [Streptomyces sp. NPDC007983]|uniref:acyl-CoA thioesterase n=1 Tax=Streptomyces sp. NPDC007983 TaxID=3364800 RepID=UPI0036EFE51A
MRLAVRHSDLDTNGHLRGSAYVDFADHARWTCVREAGVDPLEMSRSGLGPVNLETTIRYHRELRAGVLDLETRRLVPDGALITAVSASARVRRCCPPFRPCLACAP